MRSHRHETPTDRTSPTGTQTRPLAPSLADVYLCTRPSPRLGVFFRSRRDAFPLFFFFFFLYITDRVLWSRKGMREEREKRGGEKRGDAGGGGGGEERGNGGGGGGRKKAHRGRRESSGAQGRAWRARAPRRASPTLPKTRRRPGLQERPVRAVGGGGCGEGRAAAGRDASAVSERRDVPCRPSPGTAGMMPAHGIDRRRRGDARAGAPRSPARSPARPPFFAPLRPAPATRLGLESETRAADGGVGKRKLERRGKEGSGAEAG